MKKNGKKTKSLFFCWGGLFILLSFLVFIDTGLKGIMVLASGVGLGIVFLYFQYSFSAGWRKLLETGDTRFLGSHFIFAGLCALAIIPSEFWNFGASPSIAPVSLSLLLGAFMFGLGMQLANGCGSGVLFTFGGGSSRMIIAMPFFILGSVIGSVLLPSALAWGSLGEMKIAGNLPGGARFMINILLLFGLGLALLFFAIRKNRPIEKNMIYATIAISFLAVIVFLASGHPWSVTFGFALWGAKISQALGVPIGETVYWGWPASKYALDNSVLSNASSLANIGMFAGAALLASLGMGLSGQGWPPRPQMVAAIIGGLLMGIGARFAFGCNIGAFIAGIASGSVHGWVWLLLALAGCWVGIRLRPRFGF